MLAATVRRMAYGLSAVLLLCSCSSPPLSVQISPDGSSFSWRLNGKEVDPIKQRIQWDMTYEYAAEEHISGKRKRPGPTGGKGTATIKDSKNTYDALVEFNLDDEGYRHIKLTVSGGTLSKVVTAEANRP